MGLGVQDISEHESGAYTGEISGLMLAEYFPFLIAGGKTQNALPRPGKLMPGSAKAGPTNRLHL